MRDARWTFVLFLVSGAALAGAFLATSGPVGAEDPTRPDVGSLAPLLEPPPRRVPRALVSPELGEVRDLSLHGGTMAVLASDGWLLQSASSSVEWERSRSPGSPDWLGRPVSIALGPDSVYVLDGDRSVVSVWDRAGHRGRDLRIPSGSTYARRPTQMLLGPRGSPLVALQRVENGGEAFWDLLAVGPEGDFEAVLSLPRPYRSMVFSEPLLAFEDSTLFSMAPLTHGLSRVDLKTGRLVGISDRADPPMWYVPRRHRREYQRMIRGLGGNAAGLAGLPDRWPSVRDFTVQDDGSVLLAVTAGEDRVHIELLTLGMEPVGRFSEKGFLESVFLSRGRAFIAEEQMNGTVIHELLPHTR
jgi:hypothetical protein